MKPWRALGGCFLGGSFWRSVFPLLSFYMDQSVGYSRLSWVWPRGYNHGVRQARYYTQSLCNNHTFAFNAGFPYVCKLGNNVNIKLYQSVNLCQPQRHKAEELYSIVTCENQVQRKNHFFSKSKSSSSSIMYSRYHAGLELHFALCCCCWDLDC